MRKIVHLAENDRRSGRRAFLLRDADRLFAHFAYVISVLGLYGESGPAKDYAEILKLLLLEPEYSAAADVADWESLINTHVNFLGSVDRPKADDVHRGLGSLTALLERSPADLSPSLMQDVSDYLRVLGGEDLFNDQLAISKYGANAFGAATAFLFACGRDVAMSCPALHEAFHKPMMRVLREQKPSKTKERAVAYGRAQLKLGGVSQGHLADLQLWASTEIQKIQWYALF